MNQRTTRLLSAALAIATISGGTAAQNPKDKKAMAEFGKAERAIQDSKYGTAHTLYRRIARKYPNSIWGKMAAFRTQPTAYLGWGDLQRHGESDNRVDVVVMGDGYGIDDQNEFEDVAKSVVDVFRRDKLLGEYYEFHNFVRVNLTSKDQGVTGFGRTKETALGGHVTGHVQGQVGVDHGKARKMLDQLEEHDGYAIAIVKAGSMGTGGGGIAAIGGRADRTLVHEWGHAFGGLSDEYSTFTGHRGTPRNSINVSVTDDLQQVPWRHFIAAKVPGVGAYRGAAGRIKGAWKPTSGGCTMESGSRWCPVCRERMLLQIYRRVDPIEAHAPPTIATPRDALRDHEGFTFEVTVLEPKTHKLDVRFHVLPASQAFRATGDARLKDRTRRGKLKPIDGKGELAKYAGRGRHKFSIGARSLEPGTYQVICRVRDDATPSGQQRPWVLQDPHQLLQSERAWWISIPPR